MPKRKKNILITGGCGFMGSHFVRYLYNNYPSYNIINVDVLTYAGNLENLKDINNKEKGKTDLEKRYKFFKGNICDTIFIENLFSENDFTFVVHFAAETHVDRSIFNVSDFIETNVKGTQVLLEAIRKNPQTRFVHISTDEVYGNVLTGFSSEECGLKPSNPYSASKAAADLLVQTYIKTYGIPAVIVRSSNNYCSHQYPEKLIPMTITNLINEEKIPVHGNGEQVRSWLFVKDFCRAVDLIAHESKDGSIYNLSGEHKTNIEIIREIGEHLKVDTEKFLRYINDRPAADLRYAPNSSFIERDLLWKRKHSMKSEMPKIISWYKNNRRWWEQIKQQKEFLDHYEKQSNAMWY